MLYASEFIVSFSNIKNVKVWQKCELNFSNIFIFFYDEKYSSSICKSSILQHSEYIEKIVCKMQHGENSRWIRISYSRSIHTQRGEAKAIEHEMKMGKNSLYSTDIWIGNLCDLMKYMLYSYMSWISVRVMNLFTHLPLLFFSTNKRDPRPSMSNTIQRWWCWWWRQRWHTERATMKFYKCTRELLNFFFFWTGKKIILWIVKFS